PACWSRSRSCRRSRSSSSPYSFSFASSTSSNRGRRATSTRRSRADPAWCWTTSSPGSMPESRPGFWSENRAMIDKVVIISTGDELTTGKIADTNAQWLADRCYELGLDVVATLVVGDYPDRINWAWQRGFELADLVLSTGGLGPTSDDLTTETL